MSASWAEANAYRTHRCKACQQPVIFLKTKAGKNMPVDAASVPPGDSEFDHTRHKSHFATCPAAARFRRK